MLRRHCEEVGRDPAEVAVTVLDLPVVGRDRDDVWARVERLRGPHGRGDVRPAAPRGHARPQHRDRYRRAGRARAWAPSSWRCRTWRGPRTCWTSPRCCPDGEVAGMSGAGRRVAADDPPTKGTPVTDKPDTATRASDLLALHRAPELLTVVNVWDVISAQVVADVEGTQALATASHSIAASCGYEDGENIPVDVMIAEVGRIAAADPPAGDRRPRGRLRRRRRDGPPGDRRRHRRRQHRGPDEAAGRGGRARSRRS